MPIPTLVTSCSKLLASADIACNILKKYDAHIEELLSPLLFRFTESSIAALTEQGKLIFIKDFIPALISIIQDYNIQRVRKTSEMTHLSFADLIEMDCAYARILVSLNTFLLEQKNYLTFETWFKPILDLFNYYCRKLLKDLLPSIHNISGLQSTGIDNFLKALEQRKAYCLVFNNAFKEFTAIWEYDEDINIEALLKQNTFAHSEFETFINKIKTIFSEKQAIEQQNAISKLIAKERQAIKNKKFNQIIATFSYEARCTFNRVSKIESTAREKQYKNLNDEALLEAIEKNLAAQSNQVNLFRVDLERYPVTHPFYSILKEEYLKILDEHSLQIRILDLAIEMLEGLSESKDIKFFPGAVSLTYQQMKKKSHSSNITRRMSAPAIMMTTPACSKATISSASTFSHKLTSEIYANSLADELASIGQMDLNVGLPGAAHTPIMTEPFKPLYNTSATASFRRNSLASFAAFNSLKRTQDSFVANQYINLPATSSKSNSIVIQNTTTYKNLLPLQKIFIFSITQENIFLVLENNFFLKVAIDNISEEQMPVRYIANLKIFPNNKNIRHLAMVDDTTIGILVAISGNGAEELYAFAEFNEKILFFPLSDTFANIKLPSNISSLLMHQQGDKYYAYIICETGIYSAILDDFSKKWNWNFFQPENMLPTLSSSYHWFNMTNLIFNQAYSEVITAVNSRKVLSQTIPIIFSFPEQQSDGLLNNRKVRFKNDTSYHLTATFVSNHTSDLNVLSQGKIINAQPKRSYGIPVRLTKKEKNIHLAASQLGVTIELNGERRMIKGPEALVPREHIFKEGYHFSVFEDNRKIGVMIAPFNQLNSIDALDFLTITKTTFSAYLNKTISGIFIPYKIDENGQPIKKFSYQNKNLDIQTLTVNLNLKLQGELLLEPVYVGTFYLLNPAGTHKAFLELPDTNIKLFDIYENNIAYLTHDNKLYMINARTKPSPILLSEELASIRILLISKQYIYILNTKGIVKRWNIFTRKVIKVCSNASFIGMPPDKTSLVIIDNTGIIISKRTKDV